jgi:alpha-tubulin suppressor-like RCC1 family protein
MNTVKQVSCGDSHTVILSSEGLVYSFGSNTGKQLGLKGGSSDVKIPTLVEDLMWQGHSQTKVTQICCANSFTFALTNTHHVFSWGTNAYGALGLGKNCTTA